MMSMLDLGQLRVGILPGIEEFAVGSLGARGIAGFFSEGSKAIEGEAGFGAVFQCQPPGLFNLRVELAVNIGLREEFSLLLGDRADEGWGLVVAELLLFAAGLGQQGFGIG